MNILIEKLKHLEVGDKVYGWGEKRAYKVFYKNDRYVVIAKAMFGEYCHSIIDIDKETAGQGQIWLFGEFVDSEDFKTGDITESFNNYLKNMHEMKHNVTGVNTVPLRRINLVIKENKNEV